MIVFLSLLTGALAGEAAPSTENETPVVNTSETNTIVEALKDQLALNHKKLSLPDAPPVYHLRYHFYEMKQYDATVTMGAILDENIDPYQYLGVEVRVGETSFDNTGFGGWENGFTGAWLPEGLTPHAVSMSAWRQTDRAYKQAVEHYSRKKAQFRPPDDYPGDYTDLEPTRVNLGSGRGSDDEKMRDLATTLSAILTGDPSILRGEVHVGQENGTHWVLDTSGTIARLPVHESTLRALIHVRTDDGMLLTDHRLWSTQSSNDFPSQEALIQDVTTMRDELLALAKSKPLDSEYVGPVLFEDHAALDIYRFLLLPQLEGTPPEIPFESFLGGIGRGGSGQARLGRRVLPMGWSVTDDPQGRPDHPSTFAYDAEGSPTEAVPAVQDGILRVPMMSRVPRKDVRKTNGHARGISRSRLSGRVAQITISPPKSSRAKALHKKAKKIADAYGHEGYYVVSRLQEPAIRAVGGSPSYSSGEDGTVNLPLPVSIYWVDDTGTRTPVRGARLTGVQRWILRDIVGVGPSIEGTFMIPSSPGEGLYSPTQGLPTWMSAPEILVGEMELVPAPGNPKSKPMLPHPLTVSQEK